MTVTAVQGAVPAQTSPRTQTNTSALVDSDFETFLRMLTVQLQNQDPLDPIDNSEYAVQLATFSGVEQQVKTNDLLETLGTQFGIMGLSELAGWVGKQARADMPVAFAGQPVTFHGSARPLADAAELVVKDATGQVVAREPILPGSDKREWKGTADDGTVLPNGRYTAVVESFANGQLIGTDPAEIYAEVIEARNTGGTTTLVFPDGVEVAADKITALRSG
jgi:flagellar basal-body rod modification protein FlgD